LCYLGILLIPRRLVTVAGVSVEKVEPKDSALLRFSVLEGCPPGEGEERRKPQVVEGLQ
jgi:hypothetical protein